MAVVNSLARGCVVEIKQGFGSCKASLVSGGVLSEQAELVLEPSSTFKGLGLLGLDTVLHCGEGLGGRIPLASVPLRKHRCLARFLQELLHEIFRKSMFDQRVVKISRHILIHHIDHPFSLWSVGNNQLL